MTEGERREYIAAVIEEATDDVVLFGVYPDEERRAGFASSPSGAGLRSRMARRRRRWMPCLVLPRLRQSSSRRPLVTVVIASIETGR